MPLRADNLSFAYRPAGSPPREVLRSVSLEIPPGAITAIIGPNGCGKTTLVRLLAGLLEPDSGQIRLDGKDPAALSEPERASIAVYIPQRSAPAFDFTCRQVVAFGALGSSARTSEALATDALAQIGLADRAGEPVGNLSAGQQQRVALARALTQIRASGDPKALLADEPTSALDPRHAIDALGLLRRLAGEGLAIALVIHDFSLAAQFADRCALLNDRGALEAVGEAREVLRPDTLGSVFGVEFKELTDGTARALTPVPPSGR